METSPYFPIPVAQQRTMQANRLIYFVSFSFKWNQFEGYFDECMPIGQDCFHANYLMAKLLFIAYKAKTINSLINCDRQFAKQSFSLVLFW